MPLGPAIAFCHDIGPAIAFCHDIGPAIAFCHDKQVFQVWC